MRAAQVGKLLYSEKIATREHERMAAETPEERETRLQQMSTNQHEWLTVETPTEREMRLQQTAEWLNLNTSNAGCVLI